MYEHEQYLTEECYHEQCSDTRWSRYCSIEATDVDGDAGVVLDQLNTLLYGTPTFERGGFFYQADNDSQHFSRSFSHEYFPDELTAVVGYQQQTTISHEQLTGPSRQAYRVVSEWYISDEDSVDGVYRTEFYIEQYPGSRLMATVTEYDLSMASFEDADNMQANSRVDRPMTGYDHQQLHRLLSDVGNLQLAEATGS